MGTEENKTSDSKCSFRGCEEMMKMMGKCMEGKGHKVDFEKLCAKMPDCCKSMFKKGDQA
jgi:hypothetical protein